MRYLLFLSLLLLFGCQSTSEGNEPNSREFYNTVDISKKEDIQYHSFTLDTLKMNPEGTSYVGKFLMWKDTLYFVDERFSYIFQFTNEGEFIQRHAGKGKGPNEVLNIDYLTFGENEFVTLNGNNNSFDVFDTRFEKKDFMRIDESITRSYEEMLNNPIPSLNDVYEYDYALPKILKKWGKERISIIITASHPKFNGYFDSDLYYNQARCFGIVNLKTGKLEKILGRRSPIYLSQQNIPNFDHLNYDTYEESDEVYLNFWADSDIYLYSKQKNKIKGKFGKAGRDMKTDYRRTNTFEDAENNWKSDYATYGYYTFLKYFPEKQLIFRGYSKGKGATNHGLQIYKNHQLIADLDVPKGFEIIGHSNGMFYGVTPQDPDIDFLTVYKIKFSQ
ncbi:hypothetical protein CGC49_00215 [Capnocytophaga sp. H4358]|uniref:hypothetical protein n=1 Tax=Capnocytophaga sp. H4358 TaxID=1945658 RepID=UPI000BB1E2AE|nr:hypothetical protein [Capnocytophaga sp. H4358]ATA71875.1 hypothetical protein CGC49_00215 [Capnocytophaga sp. H4358]